MGGSVRLVSPASAQTRSHQFAQSYINFILPKPEKPEQLPSLPLPSKKVGRTIERSSRSGRQAPMIDGVVARDPLLSLGYYHTDVHVGVEPHRLK
jgi:hypothetical protein